MIVLFIGFSPFELFVDGLIISKHREFFHSTQASTIFMSIPRFLAALTYDIAIFLHSIVLLNFMNELFLSMHVQMLEAFVDIVLIGIQKLCTLLTYR